MPGAPGSLLSPAVGTNAQKHARQKEARGSRLQEATTRAKQSSRRRRAATVVGVLVGVVVIGAGIWMLTGSGDDKADSTASTTTAPGGSTTTVDKDAATLPRPDKGITLTEATPCPPAEGTAKRVERFAGPPPTCIDPTATYTATFSTTKGDFTATLDAKQAPISVNNFVVLARYRFYDSVPFHRIVPGFVIQAGDGDGEPWGTNDLGYTIQDELPKSSAEYVDGALAMANSGANTNGSQFFVVLPGGGGQLQPNYSLFGRVTEGQDVVDAIGKLGDAQQQPTEAVVIKSVKIDEKKP